MTEAKARANVLLQSALAPSLERMGLTLRELGLTGHAANVFCALVRMSDATAADLMLKTGIPDSKIYYALEELVEKGLVEVQKGKPKAYRVVPPREVKIRLMRTVDEDYERRQAATVRLVSLLEPLRASASSPTADLAYIVKGLPNIAARAAGLIAS